MQKHHKSIIKEVLFSRIIASLTDRSCYSLSKQQLKSSKDFKYYTLPL